VAYYPIRRILKSCSNGKVFIVRRTPQLAALAIALSALAACGSDKTGGKASSPESANSSAPNASGTTGTGSGGSAESKKSATDILTDTKQAALDANSVHITGGPASSALDVVVTKSGQIEGSLVDSGKPMQVIVVSPSEAYGKTAETKGQFVRLPQSNAQSVAKSLNKQTLLTSILKPSGTITNSGASTKDGKQVIGITSGKGSTLYLADDPTHPYPLGISNTSAGKGSVTFTGWDAQVAIKAPATSH
jgi:hypothetical protein